MLARSQKSGTRPVGGALVPRPPTARAAEWVVRPRRVSGLHRGVRVTKTGLGGFSGRDRRLTVDAAVQTAFLPYRIERGA